MITVHIATVYKVTTPAPYSYNGKKGLVSGFESFITGETAPEEPGGESKGLAQVSVRAATPDAVMEKLERLKVAKGQSAVIKIRLFDVGRNEMYSVNAA